MALGNYGSELTCCCHASLGKSVLFEMAASERSECVMQCGIERCWNFELRRVLSSVITRSGCAGGEERERDVVECDAVESRCSSLAVLPAALELFASNVDR